MKNITLKIICFFILLLPLKSFAQFDLSNQFEYCKKLFNEEKYYDSITELKRLLFFDKKNLYGYSANFMIGESYKEGAKFSDAILYFTLAEINAKDSMQISNSKIEIIRSNILRKTFIRALQLLDSLSSAKRFATEQQINYWRGWAYALNDKWGKAANSWGKVDSAKSLTQLAQKVEDEKYPVTFVKALSYIIPGAGQIYTGNYLSGLLSLGWNILSGYLTINAFAENRIFDGFVIGNLLWLRFYNGNLQNAEKFAKEENLKIANSALLFLQTKFRGVKP